MSISTRIKIVVTIVFAGTALTASVVSPRASAQEGSNRQPQGNQQQSSFTPVVEEPLAVVVRRDKAAKSRVMAEHQKRLEARYDLTRRVDANVKMTRGKPIPVGPTVRLASGVTWEQLGRMSPEEIRDKGVFPYLPLPHVVHAVGGMVFPQTEVKLLPRLERFDMDFDLPDHFLPEFPPAIFLTTRPDLGDVSKGQVVTIDNFYDLFNGILNPKQLDGLRLLVTQFPQQQFNGTADRKTEKPDGMRGVTCFDCHVNGHTSGAMHLVGDIRPQENRRRIETPSLRGVNIQRLFGSQRALKTVEDFTEFEQRAAYFDGDPVLATKKGLNILDRGAQVHNMSEFQEILDFPPAPRLNLLGRLDRTKASESEIRGEELFFGKANCAACHTPPFYTDGLMHDLKVERFYKPRMEGGMMITAQGPIKTFPLRGIKESPPYLHDGRLLTLEDTVEFFNLVMQLSLSPQEKTDMVAFLRVL
ncbi:MAG TPA: cytochrome B6 [Blastocatellia bacterium]|jgi:cytochrome c peroxidase|nr:cytochrome B6 [Blastocatellia bacterium]